MATTAMTRRKGGTPMKTRLKNALARAKNLKIEAEKSRVPTALMHGGCVLGGAAAAGGLKALAGEELAGVDVGVVGGLVAVGAGIGFKSPALIMGGAGMMAPYAHDAVFDAVSAWRDNAEDADVGPRAVQS